MNRAIAASIVKITLAGNLLLKEWEKSKEQFTPTKDMFSICREITLTDENMCINVNDKEHNVSLSLLHGPCTSILKKGFGTNIDGMPYKGLLQSFFNNRIIMLFENENDYNNVVNKIETILSIPLENVDPWCME